LVDRALARADPGADQDRPQPRAWAARERERREAGALGPCARRGLRVVRGCRGRRNPRAGGVPARDGLSARPGLLPLFPSDGGRAVGTLARRRGSVRETPEGLWGSIQEAVSRLPELRPHGTEGGSGAGGHQRPAAESWEERVGANEHVGLVARIAA